MTAKTDAERAFDGLFGSWLRDTRVRMGLSQETVAGAIDTTYGQVQRYEAGKNRISLSRFLTVCDALGVPPAQAVAEIAERTSIVRRPAAPTRQRMEIALTLNRLPDRILPLALSYLRSLARAISEVQKG